MTQEERDIVLKECNKKILEIESKKQENEQSWNNYYRENYKVRFAIEDGLDSFVNSKIAKGTIVLLSAGIFTATRSFALSIGIPVGGSAIVIASDFAINLFNDKKKREYWTKLEEHQKEQSKLDSEGYPYYIASEYLTSGDKYLLHQYRQNLDVDITSEEKNDMDYLDIDTTTLSPLMVKVVEEMKSRTVSLKNELRDSLVADIRLMHTQIVESSDVSIPELEAVQKMLKKYVPGSNEQGTLTS